MNGLRSVLFVAALVAITPPFSFVALLTCWLPRRWRYHIIGQWNRLTIFLLRLCCGIRHEVQGLENLPKAPFVLCANHQSAWETIAFYQIFPPASFVIKRSLLLIPFFGWGLYIAMEPIPIDRSARMDALRRVLARGREKMARGLAVVVFPQGHRIPAGERAPFQPSAAMLATEAGVPLVPVALNSGRCWPGGVGGLGKRPGTITVSVGPPLATAGRRAREVSAEAEAWISAEMDRIGA
ncbi:MAG: 1-acyl-sn-glycerol-3-phosphate acyltransferase [Betaproteobacteria bacterium AqS2]|uniref:1-acyl-sn-glycerol-3-phosphate acyltransferase n=1 Tax=Candidatus Amphirhobacter heronislandensis TaxID=1732024 RepID=A0A930UBT8_9GAMM|nr:1-acyl-sn-glycerol-3-phosphate acyltransferase [Betaproteobacteria bacterium AqS2]